MKVWDQLIMKQRRETGRRKTVVWNKPLPNVVLSYVVCRVMLGKIS